MRIGLVADTHDLLRPAVLRRFKLPVSAGELLVGGGRVQARLATFEA